MMIADEENDDSRMIVELFMTENDNRKEIYYV